MAAASLKARTEDKRPLKPLSAVVRGSAAPRPEVQAVPIPRGGSTTERTVRELLPWHEIERKLAPAVAGAWEEEESNDTVAPPSSGVRVSESGIPVRGDDDPALSYKVYTVAELDKQQPPTYRQSMLSFTLSGSPKAPASTAWTNAGKSLYAVLETTAEWLVVKGEKPALGQALAYPLGAAQSDVKAALRTVDWKKTAVAAGAGLGVMAVLLVIVLVVADLTDEMKPARAMNDRNDRNDRATPAALETKPAEAKVEAKPVVTAAPAPPQAPATIEIGDEPAPAPAKVAKASKKAAARAKKAAAEDFIP